MQMYLRLLEEIETLQTLIIFLEESWWFHLQVWMPSTHTTALTMLKYWEQYLRKFQMWILDPDHLGSNSSYFTN